VGILAYRYTHPSGAVGVSAAGVGYVFGESLVYGLILWAIFEVAVGRKLGAKKGMLAFVAILAALTAGGIFGAWHQEQSALQASAEIKKAYAPFLESLDNSQSAGSRRVDGPVTADGAFGKLEGLIKTFVNQMLTERQSYLAEMTAIGWPHVLDNNRIAGDPKLVESERIVQKAGDLVRKHGASTAALYPKMRKTIEDMSVTPALKSEMLRGFDHGAGQSVPQLQEYWDLEADIVSQVNTIFELLAARNGGWEVRDGKLLFANQADLDAYNTQINAIQTDAAKERAIHEKAIAGARKTLQSLP